MFKRFINCFKASILLNKCERNINKVERLSRKARKINKKIEIASFLAKGYLKEANKLLEEE